MPRRTRATRRPPTVNLMIALLIALVLFASIALSGYRMMAQPQQLPNLLPSLRPVSQPETNLQPSNPLEAIGNAIIKSLETLFNPGARSPANAPLGMDVELGYTSVKGETHSIVKSVLAGVVLYDMRGVYVKPVAGTPGARSLKLYDPDTGAEGSIWVRPTLNVAVFNGTPRSYSFKVDVKVYRDGEEIGRKRLTYEGFGAPPKRIVLEKVEVRGAMVQQILERRIQRLQLLSGVQQEQQQVARICFTADYEGAIVFEEAPDDPVYRKVTGVQLGCFEFNQIAVGAFEMITEKDVEVRPLAQVLVGGESGMGGMTPTVETQTIAIPYTTTVTGGTTVTVYNTVTQVVTRWQTTTVTTIATVTVTVTRVGNVVGPLAGVVIMHPYSEFLFVPGS